MERKETFIENILMASMILLFGIVLFVVLKGWIEGRFSSIASLRSYIQEFGLLGPFILTIIQVLQVVLPEIPDNYRFHVFSLFGDGSRELIKYARLFLLFFLF